ncbi:MAG: MoxR family ATPase [Nitrospirae bacterium]|nr:MoxR family ATPase [Nitrospirota bacterium]MBF0615193.1 MoxR family ATPase [Nitrospirota bacterium]
MSFPYYNGNGQKRSEPYGGLPKPLKLTEFPDPENYLPDEKLKDACNAALLLGQPLLITGEPGTGKTMFAYSLAAELGFDEPLKFETKSTSVAKDLFYSYDTLRRFHDSRSNDKNVESVKYISFNALGEAILRTREKDYVQKYIPDYSQDKASRSVVLIDEVDKASRDFPNDILNELEHMYFKIPELENCKIEADHKHHPIVIITSNTEKDLPNAFLRRCVYYNIPFPKSDVLSDIISLRLGHRVNTKDEFFRIALSVFNKLREDRNIHKKPSTAELLGWIVALREIIGNGKNTSITKEIVLKTIGIVVKTENDQKRAEEVIKAGFERKESWLIQQQEK